VIPDLETDVYGAPIVWVRMAFFFLGGCLALSVSAFSRGVSDASSPPQQEAISSTPRAASVVLPSASATEAEVPRTLVAEPDPSPRTFRARAGASRRRARERSARGSKADAILVDRSPSPANATHAELVRLIERGEQPGGDRWRTVESMERYVERWTEDRKERLNLSRCLMAAKLVVDEPASLRSLRRCVDGAFVSKDTQFVVGVRN
jgi:hypothetical protein